MAREAELAAAASAEEVAQSDAQAAPDAPVEGGVPARDEQNAPWGMSPAGLHVATSPRLFDHDDRPPAPLLLVVPEARAPEATTAAQADDAKESAPTSDTDDVRPPSTELPSPAETATPSAPAPTSAPPPTPDAQLAAVAAPEPAPDFAVVVAGVGLAANTLSEAAQQACRALASGKALWATLDETLSALSCALRAAGQAPREAFVMGSDGRLGATGALPFDLDPARVVARVRDGGFGSVVSDEARALVGARGAFRCPADELPPSPQAPKQAGLAGVLLRDARGTLAGGLVSAPAQERAEGYLSPAVFPGDYLHVQEDRATLLIGPDPLMRARSRARELSALDLERELPPDHALVRGTARVAWIAKARAGSLQDDTPRFEWHRSMVPVACLTEKGP